MSSKPLLKDDIIIGQKNQIDVAESICGELCQEIELPVAKTFFIGQDRQIEIAFGMIPAQGF
jgi:hypothetical protein